MRGAVGGRHVLRLCGAAPELGGNRGATAEEITQEFPSLQLSDVYQVIGYYLKHSAELAEYFENRESAENELLAAHRDEWSPRGFRERLLARRKNP